MKDLLTSADIAKMIGLKTDTIYTYRKRNTLPEPDHYIGRNPVWKKETIQKWNQSRNRLVKGNQ